MGNYLKKINEEWYYDDIKEIAKENKPANLMFKILWSSNHERKDRYKWMYRVLISYLVIAFFTKVSYCNPLILPRQKNSQDGGGRT
jgi:hypothetical protein